MNLKIPVTHKIHAVFHHIQEFCDKKKMGLGYYSEQAAESIHSDFKSVWKNFDIRDTNHPNYGQHLLRAVVAYNSQHL